MTEIIISTSADGNLVVDSRSIASQLGIQHKNFLATIKKYQIQIEQAFGRLLFETEIVKHSLGGFHKVNFVYLTEDRIKFLLSRSRNGLSQKCINKFKVLGFDFRNFIKVPVNRKLNKEFNYRKSLCKKLNISFQVEVKTLAGKIDVLTPDEIIEIKAVNQWKNALGQIIVYGYYYPRHQKRIHLFGEVQESYLNLIKKHCKKFKVQVTWEP